jgi:hypothetical protein
MKQLSNVEIGRLRALADLLDDVPPNRFDLDGWAVQLNEGCGFAGCAVGWAAHSGIFPGLRFNTGIDCGAHASCVDVIYEEDEKDIWKGWVAVEVLFGLTFRSAGFLFSLDHYPDFLGPTPRVVARRLRRFADKVEGRLRLRKARRKLARAA